MNLASGQSNNVEYFTNNNAKNEYLKADNFYLTHYLYLDLFLREDLYTEANADEVAYILSLIKNYSSIEHPLDIVIKLNKKNTYKLRIKIVEKDGEVLFIVFTNYNLQTKKFDKEITGESYTRWYFLNGSKMTYRKDMSRENDYKTMNDIDLANSYLFDEIAENDNQVENTVQKGIKSEEDKFQIFIGDLIKLKNSIYQDDLEKTKTLISQIETEIKSNNSEKRIASVQSMLDVTKFQIELIKLLE